MDEGENALATKILASTVKTRTPSFPRQVTRLSVPQFPEPDSRGSHVQDVRGEEEMKGCRAPMGAPCGFLIYGTPCLSTQVRASEKPGGPVPC